jgi:hypothetical protein
MSFEERNTLTAILCNLLVTGLFVWQIVMQMNSGSFDGPDGLLHWARLVLVMIVVSIAASIVLTILINIAFRLTTGAATPRHLVDERDQLIRLRGAQVTLLLASGCFVAALGGLAYGVGIFLTLNLMLASFSIGEIGGSLTKFALQRAWI